MLSKIFALYGLNFFFGNLVLAGAVLIVPITLALTRPGRGAGKVKVLAKFFILLELFGLAGCFSSGQLGAEDLVVLLAVTIAPTLGAYLDWNRDENFPGSQF
jgi:hypothetical protein